MATRKTKTKVKTKVKVSKNQPVLTITHRPFLTRASPSPLRAVCFAAGPIGFQPMVMGSPGWVRSSA
jgi:hypothetical protein